MSFLDRKIWNKLSSNIKKSCNYSFFHARFEEILINYKSEQLYLFFWQLFAFFLLFFFVFITSRGTLMEVRTVFYQNMMVYY